MLNHRHVSQTPEQLLLREEAAAQNPAFATLEGRAMQDVRDTLSYFALGMRPETVLGGLMMNQFGTYDSTFVDATGRSAIEIAVRGDVDPTKPNERGDKVQDVLEGLVGLGIVERAFDPGSVDAALTPDDDHRKRMNRPYYRLSTQDLPAPVQKRVDRATQAQEEYRNDNAQIEARARQKAERKADRTSFFRRNR